MKRGRLLFAIAAVCSLVCGVAAQTAPADEPADLRPAPVVTPQAVDVGLRFGGAQLRIEGRAESGEQVIVVLRGQERDEGFNRKRRFGPIWISSGQVHVSGVPSLWLLFSSAPVGKILDREAIQRYRLDRTAVMAPIHIAPEDEEAPLFRSQYFELKQSQLLYGEHPGAVELLPPNGGGQAYRLDFAWPKTAPPATYRVHVYLCNRGGVVGRAEAPLEVRKVGLPKQISEMSLARASLYGLLCVLAAAAAGFGMDKIVALAGGKRASH